MKKRSYLFLCIGLFLFTMPFIFKEYSLIRLFSVIIGILFINLFMVFLSKKNLITIIITPLILLSFSYTLDYFLVNVYSYKPIYAIAKKSSKKVEMYYSSFYRVYDCNDILTIDNNYNLKYACQKDDIDIISVNDFFLSDSHSSYIDKFVHIKGKVSKIMSDGGIYISPYEGEIELNGYVKFIADKNILIKDIELSDLHVYDEIEIVGRVVKNIGEIELKDAILYETDLYNNYEISVDTNSSGEAKKMYKNIYYYNINNIIYTFDSNNIYEMLYLLEDERISLDKYKVNGDAKEEYTVYTSDYFKVISCNEKDVIAPLSFDNNQNICNIIS